MTVVDRDQAIAAALAAMDRADFDAESITPAGPDTYGRLMRVRVMDLWFHEQDVREATGRPGRLGGPAAAMALDEISAVLGHRMAGGRLPPGVDTGARLDGDAALGEQVMANLAFMI